ncbi:MAG: diacylglyceryl transferase [Bacteroidetes bacterium]|nr:MAG: diacylglyceryl transferase [Bacteroidota bacterium]
MYPRISDLLLDLFGIDLPLPIQSFGFFVAISFLLGGYALAEELKRKESEGLVHSTIDKVLKGAPASLMDLLLSGIIGFLVGYKLLYALLSYSDFVINPQDYILSFEGSLIGGIAGLAISAFLKFYDKKRVQLETPVYEDIVVHPHELIGNIVIIAAVAGLLGAKIFHNLENMDDFIDDPIGMLVSFSGLTFYGGMICGAGAVLYYMRKKGVGVLHMLDAGAPGLILAYGVGRIGCQVAGDGDWGIPNDMPQPAWLSFMPEWVWAYDYPNNVLGIDLQRDFAMKGLNSETGKAFPTPLYETAMALTIFAILWAIRKRITIPGMIFSIYLVFNGVERFFIEKIRINTVYEIFGNNITQAEIISTFMFLLGVTGIIYFAKRGAPTKS